MVRLKNRYLLLHILYPSTPCPQDNPVPPTLLFNAPSPPALTPSLLLGAIRTSVTQLYGDYGLGAIASSLAIKYLSQATSTAIVRVARKHYRMVWAAVTFLTGLAGRECVVRVGRVCGTIRGAEKEAIRRAKTGVGRVRREAAWLAGLAGLGVVEGEGGERAGNWRFGGDGEDGQEADDAQSGGDDGDDDDDDGDDD